MRREQEENLYFGVRGDEGLNRKTKYKSCFTSDMKFTPLWDLSDEIEKEIYEQFQIPQPYIYIWLDRSRLYGLSLWCLEERYTKRVGIVR